MTPSGLSAADVIRLLEEHGATVEFHDPHIDSVREDGHVRKGVSLTKERLEASDAVVIVTDHHGVDYQMVVDNARLIVDSRNITAGLPASKARIVSLSARSNASGT